MRVDHKDPARPAPRKGFRVAVLLFKYTGGSADLTALAEGPTEEVATLRHLTVPLLVLVPPV